MNQRLNAGAIGIQTAPTYEAFVELNKGALASVMAQVRTAIPRDAEAGVMLECLHWELIDEMKGHLGSAAANACSDDKQEQEAALCAAERSVVSDLSSEGVATDGAMALYLRGERDGLQALREALGIASLSLSAKSAAAAIAETPLLLVPSGRFITDNKRRKVAEMMQPGDSPAEMEAIKRRIVGSFNALPELIGVMLHADRDGALWKAMEEQGVSDSFAGSFTGAVNALGDEALAQVASRFGLDLQAVRAKVSDMDAPTTDGAAPNE